MENSFIEKVCSHEQCLYQEKFIETKTWEGAVRLSELLTKEAHEFCFFCNAPIKYEAKEGKINKIKYENKFEKEITLFVSKQANLVLKKKKGRYESSWVIYTKERVEEFDDLQYVAGDFATIYPKIEKETYHVVLNTNHHPKEILHHLARGFRHTYVTWGYDQLDPPHWSVGFDFESESAVINFLEEILRQKSIYEEMGYQHNLNSKHFYYSIKERQNTKGEWVRMVSLVEQDDWEHFQEFMNEHYHGACRPIQEVMGRLGAENLNDSAFTTSAAYEDILTVFDNHPQFEYNPSFDAYFEN